jgi:hypothetical protein
LAITKDTKDKTAKEVSAMKRKTGLCLMVVASMMIYTSQAKSIDSELTYKVRGKGANLRYEGVRREKKSGTFKLISFDTISPQLDIDAIPEYINIKFFLPTEGEAFISAREIDNAHSYYMDVQRSKWPIGICNHFSWPTTDVIKPLGIALDNLSVIISERNYGGSGVVYPAIIYSNQPPNNINNYRLIFRSIYTCAPLTWELDNVVDRNWSEFKHGSIKNAVAKKSHAIELDFSSFDEGWYKIELTCERKGKGSGGGRENKQVRHYEFYHLKTIQ